MPAAVSWRHTGQVHVLAVLWHFGIPAALVVAAAGILVTAFRGSPAELFPTTGWDWLRLAFLPILAGDAAFGDQRSTFERIWKGSVAALFGLALAVLWWGRRFGSRAKPADEIRVSD
jgi:hypothetical protein